MTTRKKRSKPQSKVLSRADFMEVANNFKRELVPVPSLNGSVFIGELSSLQIIEFNERIKKLELKDKKDVTLSTSVELMALLISMSACDGNGNPLFAEADVIGLTRNNPNMLMELSAKVLDVSGMKTAAIDEVTDNLKKVSGSSPTN